MMKRGSLLLWLYGLGTTLLAPVAGCMLAFRARGRARWRERFGMWGLLPGRYAWFHGASAGELRGLLPVLHEWRLRYPNERILVTATTATGYEPVKEIAHEFRILPFDSPLFLWLALRSVTVRIFVATETELWPQLLVLLCRRGVPRCLVNARISQRSFPRYQRVARLIGASLNRYQWIACGDQDSYERLCLLGADQEKLELLGNTKFDVDRPSLSTESSPFWTAYAADDRPTIVLGCIRPGEELWWFAALRRQVERHASFRVVIAPRHKEKFGYFAERLEESGIPFIRRSAQQYDAAIPGVLLDQFGELARVYQGAVLSFIGATLVPLGGHNPLEPAAWGSFVVVGPSFDTYEPMVNALVREGAGSVLRGQHDVERVIEEAIKETACMREKGAGGVRVWEAQRGATKRVMARLESFYSVRQ